MRSAAQRGWTVLSGRPDGAEVLLSFSGLADLLGPVDLDALPRLPPVQRRALDVALLKSEAGTGTDARTVSTAALSVLRELALAAPVLVAIDDAQWLDPPTAHALGFALRRVEERPIALFVTLRDEGATTPLMARSVPVERQTTAWIGPLDQATTKAVLRLRYPGLSLRAVNKIAAASGGNPFYAIEIGREVLTAGPGSGTVPLPTQLRDLIRRGSPGYRPAPEKRWSRWPARAARAPARSTHALWTGPQVRGSWSKKPTAGPGSPTRCWPPPSTSRCPSGVVAPCTALLPPGPTTLKNGLVTWRSGPSGRTTTSRSSSTRRPGWPKVAVPRGLPQNWSSLRSS